MSAARNNALTQRRLALLGLFAIAAMLLLAAGLYVVSNAGPGRGNYKMGVHFATAGGISSGAQVTFSGANIGTVSKVRILPDNSIELILAIRNNTDIPRGSTFSIHPSFTGSPSIAISPPRAPGPLSGSPTPMPRSEILPKRVLPIAEQPVGTAPLTIEQLMHQGMALTSRGKVIMDRMQARRGPLLRALRGAQINGFAARDRLGNTMIGLQSRLGATMRRAQANASEAAMVLRTRDQTRLAALAGSMEVTARSAQAVQQAMQSDVRTPAIRANMRQSAAQLQVTMRNMRALSASLQRVTGNPQTRAELRDAGMRFRSVIEKLRSLL